MVYPMRSTIAPYNQTVSRLGNTPGGPVDAHPRFAPAPGQVTNRLRAPQNVMEPYLDRERIPWLKQPEMIPPGYGGYTDWTGQGNIRRSLHMRDVTINTMQGVTNTRAQDPIPTGYGIQSGTGESLRRQLTAVPTDTVPHGLHSRVQGANITALQRSRMTPQQRPGYQNRLQPNGYVGQSYSQTTAVQGSRF